MKSLFFIAMLSTTMLVASPALAGEGGSCHFHGNKPAAESVVKDCAEQRRASLVKSGKLDASWQAAKPEAPEMVDGKKGKEWRVRYTNPAAADKSKQTLFLFFSPSGNFIAANFTGQ